jgi:hypothetical protein
MLAWITDLLGHACLEYFLSPSIQVSFLDIPMKLSGLVLLDEVDLHLHPTWQRRVVPVLKRMFPRLQFVVTTHSPLVLAGFERDEIISLRMEDGYVVQDEAGIEPGVLTASELLNNFFEVPRAGRPELIEKERRYLELLAIDEPLPEELTERDLLKTQLEPYWGSAGVTEASAVADRGHKPR